MLGSLILGLGASCALASQIVLSSSAYTAVPAIGNVKYILPSERKFLLNVPSTYEHEASYPLVLSFHGGKPFFFRLPHLRLRTELVCSRWLQ